MLVSIIVLFSICWGPILIDNVLVAFGYLNKYNYGYLKYMRQAFALMSYFNSCVNPIVYAFMSKNFRDSFKYALCLCFRRGRWYKNGTWVRNRSMEAGRVWKTSFPSRGGQSIYTTAPYTCNSTYAMVLDQGVLNPEDGNHNSRKTSCCTTPV